MVWTPFTRANHDRSGLRYASDTTDAEWQMIAPYMPPQPNHGRRRRTDLRAVIDALFYLLQSGCQWGLLPKEFPPKSTVHYYFKRFSQDGTWARVHDALYRQTRALEGRDESPSFAIIDSQSTKTTAEARGNVGFDAGKRVKGRKRHILVDTLGLILKAEVHSAGIQDRDGAAFVLERLAKRFPFVEKVCGDAGYQGPIARRASPRPMEIVKRQSAGFEVLPKRWIVERTFAWLGINRRLAKDFERFTQTSLAFIQTAMIKLMSRRIARFSHS